MIILNKDIFEEEVYNYEGIVIVEFWSETCEPCKQLMPYVDNLFSKYIGNIKFAKLNTSKARRLAIKERVLGLPAIVVYKNGIKVDEVNKDEATIENIEVMIKKYI